MLKTTINLYIGTTIIISDVILNEFKNIFVNKISKIDVATKVIISDNMLFNKVVFKIKNTIKGHTIIFTKTA